LFLSSPRNSVAAHSHLLKSLDCKSLITPDPTSPLIAGILAAHPLIVLKIPGIHELLDEKSRAYPYTKTFEEAKNEPLVALHTSGSTGMPKPIVWTHEWAAAYYNMIQLDPPAGYESQDRLFQGNRVFFLFPPFHVGISSQANLSDANEHLISRRQLFLSL
jgi:acyl-coenzyme A synthetase/AMP-(fatty) acid ligase